MRARSLIIAAFVLIGVISIYRYIAKPAVIVTSTQELPPTLSRHWDVGEKTAYAVGISSVTSFGSAQPMNLNIYGRFELVTLAATTSINQVLARLLEPRISLQNAGVISTEADLPATVAGLATGIFLRVHSDGTLQQMDAQSNVDSLAAQVLKQLSGAIQLGLSDDAKADKWGKIEIDGTGRYAASYASAAAAAGKSTITKDKQGYSEIFSQAATTATVQGSFVLLYDGSASWPQEVNGEERSTTSIGRGKDFEGQGRSTLSFKLLDREQVPATLLQSYSQQSVQLADPLAKQKRQDELLKYYATDRLGNLTIADLSENFGKLQAEKGEDYTANQRAIWDQIVAYVRLNSADLSKLRATLNERRATDPWVINTLLALGYVGCDQCQKVLLQEVMAREGDPDFAISLPNLLAQADLPNSETEAYVKKLTKADDDTTRHVAGLTLGSIANKIDAFDSQRAEKIVGEYIEQFDRASSTKEKLEVLSVLGNAATKAVVPIAEKLHAESDDVLRLAAAETLRNVSPNLANPILTKLVDDKSREVRESVLRTFSVQSNDPQTFALLQEQLQREKSAPLRLRILQTMGAQYYDTPGARQAIDAAESSDPEPTIRSMATNIKLGMPPVEN